MKIEFQNTLITSLAVLALMTVRVSAQETVRQKSLGTEMSPDHSLLVRDGERLGPTVKASDVIGASVKNEQDEKLGKIDNLAVDMENARVVEAIVSVGGLMGMGNARYAVPPGSLHFDASDKIVHAGFGLDKLKSSAKFEEARWNGQWQSNEVAEVYGYYGERFYLASVDLSTDEDNKQWKAVHPDRRANDLTADRAVSSNLPIHENQLGYVQRASKVIGMPVRNLQDQKLGDIENLIVDLSSGRILAVIVSSGGFLELGEELSAVPPAALRLNPDRKSFLLDVSKETLSQAPHFNAKQWPDFNRADYASDMYGAYHVRPYFNENRPYFNENVRAADNTALNVRDRNGATLTPMDQSNDSGDIHITAQIRRELTKRDNLSVYAHNVKIITSGGKVTLRGPVHTEAEKGAIQEIAASVVGAQQVENQLELTSK